jgi:hypothetical protein
MGLDSPRNGELACSEEIYGYTVSTDTNVANKQRDSPKY